MGSILLTLLIISVIVVFHESGHCLIAKRNGINVKEFSIGFGPTIASFEKGGTKYCLKAILFGGACVMEGDSAFFDEEDEEGNKEISETSMLSKSAWARFSVIAAGPIFNFVLAFFLSVIVLSVAGINPAKIYYVNEGSPAANAGILVGDTITAINGKKIRIGRDILLMTDSEILPEGDITVTVLRDGETVTVTYDATVERFLMGITYAPAEGAAITAVSDGYPAAQAGLVAGDVITSINGVAIRDGNELQTYFDEHPLTGAAITIRYVRDGVENETVLTPIHSTTTQLGFYASGYREKGNALSVLRNSFIEVGYWIRATVNSIKMLLTGQIGFSEVSGPVGVVSIVEDVVEESSSDGLLYVVLNLINLTILLSANIGVMNLLPLPALDGGRLLFILIEIVTGHPVPRKAEGIIHTVGILLLFGLMIAVMFKDIRALF